MEQTGIFRTASSRYWNPLAGCGDAAPGATTLGYTGQVPQYIGQLGAFALVNYADAQRKSDPLQTAFTLQGGRYQYVLFAASGTAYAAGQVLYWSDETAYTVTNVPPSSVAGAVAGICLTLVTQGTYWLIQTDGVAAILFSATGNDTAAIGDAVFANSATPALATSITDATVINGGVTPVSGTSAGLKRFLGIAKTVVTASTISLVYLKGLVQVQ